MLIRVYIWGHALHRITMIYGLSELGYLKVEGRGMGGRVCVLSLPGFSRSEKLQKEVVNSKQGFVAMWFSQDMMIYAIT